MSNDSNTPHITVIGIGNTLMGDDGVGVMVVEELERVVSLPNVEIIVGVNAGMGLIKYFKESDVIIAVDALDVDGAEPGALFRFDPDEAGITELRSTNIHGMGISYLVTNARMVGADPEVIVYAIQVKDVRQNDRTLTDEVRQSAGRAIELIKEELERRSGAS